MKFFANILLKFCLIFKVFVLSPLKLPLSEPARRTIGVLQSLLKPGQSRPGTPVQGFTKATWNKFCLYRPSTSRVPFRADRYRYKSSKPLPQIPCRRCVASIPTLLEMDSRKQEELKEKQLLYLIICHQTHEILSVVGVPFLLDLVPQVWQTLDGLPSLAVCCC